MWWIKRLGKTTEGLDTFGRTLSRHKFSPRRSPRVWTRAEDAARLSLQHFRGAEHHSANEELLKTKKMQEVELLIHLMTCNKHQLLCCCMSLFRNTTLIFLNTAFIILAAQCFIYSCAVMYEELFGFSHMRVGDILAFHLQAQPRALQHIPRVGTPRFAVGFE